MPNIFEGHLKCYDRPQIIQLIKQFFFNAALPQFVEIIFSPTDQFSKEILNYIFSCLIND